MPRRRAITDAQLEALLVAPTAEPILIRHYTLSPAGLAVIARRRRPPNRLGFAIQLCALRFPGRLLQPGEVAPREVLVFVAEQLDLPSDVLADYAAISRLSLPAPRAQAAGHGPSPRSSLGSQRSPGISPRGPCPSTARTAMSRPSSPAFAAQLQGLPSRRRRSSRCMSWPCSTHCAPSSLRNLRDRAILLLGFAGGLRRSEIVGPVMSPEDSFVGSGRPEFFDDGVLLTLRGKTGWREVEIGRGSSERTCPGRQARGPAEIRAHRPRAHVPSGGWTGGRIRTSRDRHVARLVKRLALAAGVRGDLSEREPQEKFFRHSLRAEFASSAESDERYVQKHVVQASAEVTRRYQRRRDRFRVSLTKAACP